MGDKLHRRDSVLLSVLNHFLKNTNLLILEKCFEIGVNIDYLRTFLAFLPNLTHRLCASSQSKKVQGETHIQAASNFFVSTFMAQLDELGSAEFGVRILLRIFHLHHLRDCAIMDEKNKFHGSFL